MVWIICENCSCENRIFHRCSVEGKIRTFSFDLSGQDAGSRVDREIRGSIIPFDGRCALSSVHTIAVTTLLVTVTLCSYGRSIGGSPHSTALRSTSTNVLVDSGAVGRYSPVFTVERARSPLGRFLLLAFPPRFLRY